MRETRNKIFKNTSLYKHFYCHNCKELFEKKLILYK